MTTERISAIKISPPMGASCRYDRGVNQRLQAFVLRNPHLSDLHSLRSRDLEYLFTPEINNQRCSLTSSVRGHSILGCNWFHGTPPESLVRVRERSAFLPRRRCADRIELSRPRDCTRRK